MLACQAACQCKLSPANIAAPACKSESAVSVLGTAAFGGRAWRQFSLEFPGSSLGTVASVSSCCCNASPAFAASAQKAHLLQKQQEMSSCLVETTQWAVHCQLKSLKTALIAESVQHC